MEKQEILDKIVEVISESTGIEPDSIALNSALFGELGINSIDMLDILFSL